MSLAGSPADTNLECYNFPSKSTGTAASAVVWRPSENCLARHAYQLPIACSHPVGEWLSLVEHLVRDQGVGGSNPLSPTILFSRLFSNLRSFRALNFHAFFRYIRYN